MIHPSQGRPGEVVRFSLFPFRVIRNFRGLITRSPRVRVFSGFKQACSAFPFASFAPPACASSRFDAPALPPYFPLKTWDTNSAAPMCPPYL